MTKLFVTPSLLYLYFLQGMKMQSVNSSPQIILPDMNSDYIDFQLYVRPFVTFDDEIIYDDNISYDEEIADDNDSANNSFEYNEQDWKPVGDKVRISLKD